MTVGKLSKLFGISRTTLLYYDKIGLLRPSVRSVSGYRLYNPADIERLNKIILLKQAGVPLSQIKNVISNEETAVFGALMKRLGELNFEIEALKNCQKQIIGLLKETDIVNSFKDKDDEMIQKILRYAEIEPDEQKRWHTAFEKQSPELHQFLLSVLGLCKKDV